MTQIHKIAMPLMGAAMLATSLGAMPAYAGGMKDEPVEDRWKREFSANVALTTDYVFRGYTQSAENPAIQGGFDASVGPFYAGVWASSIDFGTTTNVNTGAAVTVAEVEIDYYLGVKHKLTDWLEGDLGVIYYTYPGAYDKTAELDYVEIKGALTFALSDKISLGTTVYYSPEYTGKTGEIWVSENSLEISLPYNFSASGTVGYLEYVDDNLGADYWYWNVGLSKTFMEKFTLDVRYWDTDQHDSPVCKNVCDERVVGTISASF